VTLWTTGDSTSPVSRRHVFDRALGVGTSGAASELRHVIAAYGELPDFDIVHDHTLVGPLFADRLPWLPVVTTNHGPFQSDLSALYQATSERVPVIAISRHQASTARGVRLAGVIHHGVDPAAYPVGDGSGGYAVFLGRMSPDKGVETAVLAARRAGVPLLIAAKMSEAAEERYFEARIRPLLGGDLEYIGEVGGADKLELLGKALCLLNPIAWPEPFGMVMIEAMACGTPVVALRRGAVPEVVVDGVTGILCDDPAELPAAITAARNLSPAACRAHVENCFDAASMVGGYEAVYRELLLPRLSNEVHVRSGRRTRRAPTPAAA
jgi:glycosyltransferase involved in cell wall biosynthesis